MDVNNETQVETKKQSAWVLTYSRVVCIDFVDERDDRILATYTEKPTIIDLARYFEEYHDEISHGRVVRAVVFLDDLVNGRERVGAKGGWYTLKEVTES